MSENWQVNIYRINKESVLTQKLFNNLKDIKDNIEAIKNFKSLLHTTANQYNFQRLQIEEQDNFRFFLFYRKAKRNKPDWKDFLENIVLPAENFLTEINNYNESFVLFLYEIDSENLYAISGGYGFFVLQDYIEDGFGIDVLSRIVDNKNEKIIAYAKELGVTGGILGTTKHFRQNHNFHENNNFGNVYRELTTYLDKNTILKLGLDIDTKTNSLCVAKSSFKINKSINFDSLLKIVRCCDDIIENVDIKININNIRLVDKKNNKQLIESLNKELNKILWKLKSNKSLASEIDLTHKEFSSFLIANTYLFNKLELESRDSILLDIIRSINSLNKEKYITRLNNAQILSYDEENNELTKGKFKDHLILELFYMNKNYFFINGNWYLIDSTFIEDLNEACEDFITSNLNVGLDHAWDIAVLKKEKDYNLLYKNNLNTIVLDTLTPDGIEPCDILRYDDDNLYLYHVKKGFNGSMRDLCSQVFIAANAIHEDRKSGNFTYLGAVHDKMEASDTYKNQHSDKDSFIELFTGKRIIFVLAVLDDAVNVRDISDMSVFKSNVAKFSLKELIEKMNNKSFNFEICQISS